MPFHYHPSSYTVCWVPAVIYLCQAWGYWSHWPKKKRHNYRNPLLCSTAAKGQRKKHGKGDVAHSSPSRLLKPLIIVLIPLLVLPTNSDLNSKCMCLMLFLLSFYHDTANHGENCVFLAGLASTHIILYFFLADLALFVHSCPPTAHYFRQATDTIVCKGAPLLGLTLN